eukprot:1280620-Rhodomonas_salina.2
MGLGGWRGHGDGATVDAQPPRRAAGGKPMSCPGEFSTWFPIDSGSEGAFKFQVTCQENKACFPLFIRTSNTHQQPFGN